MAQTQTNLLNYVQHVIIVIQENRTPTNLFQQDSALVPNGAHLSAVGTCGSPYPETFNLQPDALGTCYDPGHNHEQPSPDWTNMWENGHMDGACKITTYNLSSNCYPALCPDTNYQYCPEMTYVRNAPAGNGYNILDPYFTLANSYGFANYMFQTNQGASFPAHQFLFSGTSAPDSNGDSHDKSCGSNYDCHKWFDAENASHVGQDGANGCVAQSNVQAYDIDPALDEAFEYLPPDPPAVQAGFPCYTHNSLPTLLGPAGVSWRYYIREKNQGGYNLWNAPAAIHDICGPTKAGGYCNGQLYQTNVQPYLPCSGSGKYANDCAPILYDIEHCNLPQVSWVIPDGNWSDHGGNLPGDGGPSWVAAIVNAVGNSSTQSLGGGQCDYWGTNPNSTISQPTVILVVWDDWGGMYDDVPPPNCGPGQQCGYYNSGNPPNGVQYVYGFRVPLLVISAYANQHYVSGADGGPSPNCTPPSYCHDFGSILNFIEYAFGTGGARLGGGLGISLDSAWPYADYFAMDYDRNDPSSYSLSDFFSFSPAGYHGFTTINNWKYPEKCFHVPNQTGCFPNSYPTDPDNDANESD